MMSSNLQRALHGTSARLRSTSQCRYTSWIAFEQPNPALYKTASLETKDKPLSSSTLATSAGPNDVSCIVKPTTGATATTATPVVSNSNSAAIGNPFPAQTTINTNGMHAGAVCVPSQVRKTTTGRPGVLLTPWREESLPALRLKQLEARAAWDLSMTTRALHLAKKQPMGFKDEGCVNSDHHPANNNDRVPVKANKLPETSVADKLVLTEAEREFQKVLGESKEATLRRVYELYDVSSI
jgi:hypothetical protein